MSGIRIMTFFFRPREPFDIVLLLINVLLLEQLVSVNVSTNNVDMLSSVTV